MKETREEWLSRTGDGPVLTAAARQQCILDAWKYYYPANFFFIGKTLRLEMMGRISTVLTTPGTARFDLCLGENGDTIVFDTGVWNLDPAVAAVDEPWKLEVDLICRSVGPLTEATFLPNGTIMINPLWTGKRVVPATSPEVGAGFDSTRPSVLNMFFTQTEATGSLTVHHFRVYEMN